MAKINEVAVSDHSASKKAEKKRKERKFISETVDYFRQKLFLHEWKIHIHYVDEKKETERDDHFVSADISCQSEYSVANIRIFPDFLEEKKEEQKRILLHELCHIITEPHSEIYGQMLNGRLITPNIEHQVNEKITQRIANIIALYEEL